MRTRGVVWCSVVQCATDSRHLCICISVAHYNTLQHTATHCNTLQHTATHYNTLQHTATHCNTLTSVAHQHAATHYTTCIALQTSLYLQLCVCVASELVSTCGVVCCSVLQCVAVCCSVLQSCSVLQCVSVHLVSL